MFYIFMRCNFEGILSDFSGNLNDFFARKRSQSKNTPPIQATIDKSTNALIFLNKYKKSINKHSQYCRAMLMNVRFLNKKIYQFSNKINSIFYQLCIHHCFVMINYKNEFCYPGIKNSNINVLIVIFIDFNQHSLVIYSAYFFFNF